MRCYDLRKGQIELNRDNSDVGRRPETVQRPSLPGEVSSQVFGKSWRRISR